MHDNDTMFNENKRKGKNAEVISVIKQANDLKKDSKFKMSAKF
jgi:hypothetical protein